MSTTGSERPVAPATDTPPAGEERVGPRFLVGYALAYFGALAATLATLICRVRMTGARVAASAPK